MGIELDVLVGHPEHELLFIGAQVAAAAGLENATGSLGNFRQSKACTLKLSIGDVIVPYSNRVGEVPKAHNGRAYHAITSLLDEANVYKMLMRSRAPQTEPFRKWVTEEVLPTIRKTGQYNAAESTNPIAVGIMDELKLLRGELVELKEIVKNHYEVP